MNRWAVAPGRRIVIATSGASAYRAALDARAADLDVRLVDLRLEPDIGPELGEARAAEIEVLAGHTVVGSTGRKRVTGLVVARQAPVRRRARHLRPRHRGPGRTLGRRLQRHGTLKGRILHVTTPSGFTRATVCDPVFVDPESARVQK